MNTTRNEPSLAELQREQVRLAALLESLVREYDVRTRELSTRLAALDRGKSEEDLQEIHSEQHSLWRIARRMQAANRTSRELQNELKEWKTRTDGHVAGRVEIVTSELRGRGEHPFELSHHHASSHEGSADDVGGVLEVPVLQLDSAEGLSREESPAWRAAHDETVLTEIQSCIREMRRILAHPDSHLMQQELADFGRQLKDLHGHLRITDRHEGTRRNRMLFGVHAD